MLRKCIVDDRLRGYFHDWSLESEIVQPSYLKGGHQGGVVCTTLGIVELEDGKVIKVRPERIRFIIEEKEKNDD